MTQVAEVGCWQFGKITVLVNLINRQLKFCKLLRGHFFTPAKVDMWKLSTQFFFREKILRNWIRYKMAFFQHLSRQFIFQLVLENKFQGWNLLFNVRRPLLKSNEKRTFISMSTNINLKNSRCLFFLCWKLSRSKDLENHKSPLPKI